MCVTITTSHTRHAHSLPCQQLVLCRQWTQSLVLHCLTRRHEVAYGLLHMAGKTAAAGGSEGAAGVAVGKGRLLAAVPFIGKGVPSHASLFAHPDVLMGK